jgi:tetratricopeptide (TPR) repeat protein
MKSKYWLAIIPGIFAVVVASIQFGPGWFRGSGKDGGNSQSITTGNIQSGGGNVSVSQTMILSGFEAQEKIIAKQDWQEAERDPAFQRFVEARYHKKIDELTSAERATFWQDMQKYLDEEKDADRKYAQIKQQSVGDELKQLFSSIDDAKRSFDYQKVDRLLQGFEEKHTDLIKDLARVYYLRGQNFELQIRYQEAERYYRKAVELDDQNPLYLNDYASILRILGNYDAAEPLYRRALQIREKHLGAEHPEVAASLNNLAALLHDQGKYAAAEPLIRRALQIAEKQHSTDYSHVATGLNNLASLLQAQGKYAAAEPLFRRALQINEKQLGADHPEVARDLNNLAALLYDQGKYAAAEPLCRRALQIAEKQLGVDHPEVAMDMANLAALLNAQGKYATAEPLCRRALQIHEKQLGADHPDVATDLNNLASLFYTQGKYAAAEPLYRRALEIREKQLGADHPDVANSLYCLAALF